MQSSKEQLQLTCEKVNTKDAEIQAIKDDRAANVKVLRQTLKKVESLQKRLANIAELHSESEGERAILRAKCEDAETVQERILTLCHAMGLVDGLVPRSTQMVDMLEEKVLALKNQQSLSVTKPNPETEITASKETQLPDAPSDSTKRARRKATRHTSTDNRNFREARTPVGSGPEREVSIVRHRETTVDITSVTHRASSLGMGAVSEPPTRPSQIDSTPAALVQETQTTNSFVPLWEIEAEAGNVPTSPFTDLSAFFAEIPEQWPSPVTEETSKQPSKPSANTKLSGKKTKIASKDGVHAPSTPKKSTKGASGASTPDAKPARKVIEKRQPSQGTLPPSSKVFSPIQDFSSPSTDHIHRGTIAPANDTSSGTTLKGIVKNGKLYKETEGEAAKLQYKTAATLSLDDRGVSESNKKFTSGRAATRGILKNPNPKPNPNPKKRGVEAAGLQVNDATKVAKRLKPAGHAMASSQSTKPLTSSAPKQSALLSGRDAHHPYSPSVKSNSTSTQRRKRSQTSEGDSPDISCCARY